MQSYLLLAKGQRGLALVDLIQKITADPAVFVFGELLDVPSVKEVNTHILAILPTHMVATQLTNMYAFCASCAHDVRSEYLSLVSTCAA